MPSMLRFIWVLIKAAASDVLRRMGTTALAIGVGLAVSTALLGYDLATGSVQAVTANWGGRVRWGIGISLAIWLFLFALALCRHFRPVRREHRRVFQMLAFNQDQIADADRITIWCLLAFCKDFGPAELLVRVTTLLPVGAPITNIVHRERLENVSRDGRKHLRLASLRIMRPHRPAYHSIWGSEVGTEDLKQGQVVITADTRSLIDISVGPQTYRCYVEFVTPPPGAMCAPMYMTDEDRSPWLLGI